MFFSIFMWPILLGFPIVTCLLVYIYMKNYIYIRNIKYNFLMKREGKEFQRNIDVIYSPSIVSYLFNQKIEPEKDLIADILNLYARNIINIVKIADGGYKLILNEEIYKKLLRKREILRNDQYIIKCIVLEKEKFIYSKWKRNVIDGYRLMGLPDDNKNIGIVIEDNTVKKQCIIIFIICGIISKIMYNAPFWEGITAGATLSLYVVVIEYIIQGITNLDELNDMFLSDIGIEELKRWMGLRNYIKTYTFIEDKTSEAVVLYEKYIPFAMTMNINKKYIEELMKIVSNRKIIEIWQTIRIDYDANSMFMRVIRQY